MSSVLVTAERDNQQNEISFGRRENDADIDLGTYEIAFQQDAKCSSRSLLIWPPNWR
jgi:hypothetical protein